MTKNRVIGRDGDMPWRLSSDLRRFKRITMGHHLIMGRKTFDSIGRALPGRTTIVISRTATYDDPNIRVARSIDEAIDIAGDDEEVFITGGAQIYELALPRVDRVYLTQIQCELEGDTHFPKLDWSQWNLIEQEEHLADEKNNHDYSFLTYERPKPMADDLIALTEKLLASIAEADWETYETLCDSTITAFEPESCGHLVDGLAFHRFYFDLGSSDTPRQTSLLNPHIRMLGEDAAIICYTRLVQTLDGTEVPSHSPTKKREFGNAKMALGSTCIFIARLLGSGGFQPPPCIGEAASGLR